MAYECKLYIVEKRRDSNYASTIATFDLGSAMDNFGFFEPFKYEVDFEFFGDDGNEPIRKDMYGKLSYAYLEDVIAVLKPYYKEQKKLYGKYRFCRRLTPLYGLLKGFYNRQWITDLTSDKNKNWFKKDKSDYYDMLVVCYGY